MHIRSNILDLANCRIAIHLIVAWLMRTEMAGRCHFIFRYCHPTLTIGKSHISSGLRLFSFQQSAYRSDWFTPVITITYHSIDTHGSGARLLKKGRLTTENNKAFSQNNNLHPLLLFQFSMGVSNKTNRWLNNRWLFKFSLAESISTIEPRLSLSLSHSLSLSNDPFFHSRRFGSKTVEQSGMDCLILW